MAKFEFKLSYVARIEIEARDREDAFHKAHDILDSHSVYNDDALDVMHDEAYCAGGLGSDPPLRKKRAYSMRNQDFEPDEPVMVFAGSGGETSVEEEA